MERREEAGWRTLLGCGIPVVLGTAGIVHGVQHATTEHVPPTEMALLLASSFLQGGLLFAAAVWLYRKQEPRQRVAIGLWALGGWLHVGAMVVVLFLGQESSGGRITAPWVTVHLTAMGGGLLGLFVGAYHAALEQARERAEDLHAQLVVYLRLLRHDVRNDAQLIQGYADLMDRSPGTAGLNEIRSAADHVLQLTQLSQAFSADEGQELRPRDLVRVLEDVARTVGERFPDADLRIVEPTPEEVHVLADDLLESVFENIARNAIQHHDEPAPTVRVRVDADPGDVHVRIVDDGPGVPPDVQDQLFASGLPEAPGEKGIGLYLVGVIVDRYGGDVDLETTGPEGSTFRVDLPRTDPPELPPSPA